MSSNGSNRVSNSKRARDPSDELLDTISPSNKPRLSNNTSNSMLADPIAEAIGFLTKLQRFRDGLDARAAQLTADEAELAVRRSAFDDCERHLVEQMDLSDDRERDLNERQQSLDKREHLLSEQMSAIKKQSDAKPVRSHKDTKKPEASRDLDRACAPVNHLGSSEPSVTDRSSRSISRSPVATSAQQHTVATQGEARSAKKSASSMSTNEKAESNHSSMPHVKIEQKSLDAPSGTLNLVMTFQSVETEPRVKHEALYDEAYQGPSDRQPVKQATTQPTNQAIDQSVKQSSTQLTSVSKSGTIDQSSHRSMTSQPNVAPPRDQAQSHKPRSVESKQTNKQSTKQANSTSVNNTQAVSSADKALQQEYESMFKQIAMQTTYLDSSRIASTAPDRFGSASSDSTWGKQLKQLFLAYPAKQWKQVSGAAFQQQELIHFLVDNKWKNGVVVGVAQTKQILKLMQDDAEFSQMMKTTKKFPIGGLLLPLASFDNDSHESQLPPHHEYCYAVAEKKNTDVNWCVVPMLRRGWISPDGISELDSADLGAVAPPKLMLKGRKPSVSVTTGYHSHHL